MVWCGGGVCVYNMCVSSVCAVCMHSCACTRMCVSSACGLFFIGIISCTCMFLPFYYFFLKCAYELTFCAFMFMQVVTCSSSSFHIFFCLYICMCVLYLSPFFFSIFFPLCLRALNKLFNSYSICFEYVWTFLLLLYFLFFVHVYYQ